MVHLHSWMLLVNLNRVYTHYSLINLAIRRPILKKIVFSGAATYLQTSAKFLKLFHFLGVSCVSRRVSSLKRGLWLLLPITLAGLVREFCFGWLLWLELRGISKFGRYLIPCFSISRVFFCVSSGFANFSSTILSLICGTGFGHNWSTFE